VLLTHYCAGDKIEKNEIGGALARIGEGRGVYRVLVGKPKGKRPLGYPRCRWEHNIKIHLQEVGCGGKDWIGLGYINISPYLPENTLSVKEMWSMLFRSIMRDDRKKDINRRVKSYETLTI
jgi:hypothetical protein